jgi:uncharacterized membrane protein
VTSSTTLTIVGVRDQKLTTIPAVVAKGLVFGIVGWIGENMLFGPRYSPVFQGHRVPFLPVYAFGGLVMLSVAPYLAEAHLLLRGLAYAAIGTTVEYVGCQLDRRVFDARSWDYEDVDDLADQTDGCISWRHTALWGGLGLVAEKIA